MKQVLILCLFFLFIAGCGVLSEHQTLYGIYYKNGKDYEYRLKLKKDSTFILNMKYQDAQPQCEGKWQYLTNDTLILRCDSVESISQVLTNQYMTKRELKIEILNKKKLKLDNTILKKR